MNINLFNSLIYYNEVVSVNTMGTLYDWKSCIVILCLVV